MTQASAEAPLSPVSTREVGYAYGASGQGGWWDNFTDEHVPELTGYAAVAVYDRMRKSDAQVGSVLRAVTSPIQRAGWWIDGTGCPDEVTAFVAGDLGLPIKGTEPGDDAAPPRTRDRFSWNEHLRLALLMLPFGHSFFEQVYRFDDAGRARLRKLGPRLPKSISKINVARDGGLVSIEQFGASQQLIPLRPNSLVTTEPLPVNRLVAYVNEREGGNWRGQSLLRTAYKNWLLKDQALRDWSIHVNRNGAGVPMYYAGEKETSLAAGKKIATEVRAGSNAGAAAPAGAKLVLQGVEGSTPDIDKFVRYQDEQIARAVLAHVLNLGTQVGGQVGSYNLGSVLQNTFNSGQDVIAVEVRDTAQGHVVEDLVDLNFGIDMPAPRIVFDPIGSTQDDEDEDEDDPLSLLRRAAGLEDDNELAGFIRKYVPATQEVA